MQELVHFFAIESQALLVLLQGGHEKASLESIDVNLVCELLFNLICLLLQLLHIGVNLSPKAGQVV